MQEVNKKIATNLIIIISLLFIVYLPCFYELTKSWLSNPDYTHGFLVLPVSIYLAWMGKNKITIPNKTDTKFGIMLITFGLIQ
ncbi:MAG: archaeosortase/exosortase family protein, partial [Candidatus Hodarchaeota archaeon]